MKIAICGAGMGGLTAACLLRDDGHDITLFDQFAAPKPIGSGLMIQPYGQRILERIGALDMALGRGNKIDFMRGTEIRKNKPVLDETYAIGNDGAFGLAIHRSGLFDALFDAVTRRGIKIKTDFSVAHASGDTVVSTNGQSVRGFDIIVDALGASSPLSPLKSKPLKFGAVWATVDWPDGNFPKNQLSQRYDRADHMVGILPCGLWQERESAAVFWSLPQSDFDTFKTAGVRAWQKQAKTIWPDIAAFADQITNMDQFNFAHYGHGTLWQPYSGNIVHIGDAAHTASPQLGQGANMAMLDARALSLALQRNPSIGAFKSYVRMRRLHLISYQMMSWAFTPMYQSNSRFLPWLRDAILFPISRLRPVKYMLTRLVRGELVPPLLGHRF